MTEEQLALVRYRLAQADESIIEARVLMNGSMSPRSIMNRLYYAMFYAVLALLQEKRLGTSKHYGAISLFDREFVKHGVFELDMSKTLHRAFELRQRGDYMEQHDVGEEDIAEIFPKAEYFVKRIRCRLLTDTPD